MRAIAEIILYQEKHFNGDGIPDDDVKEWDIPLGARALHAALDLDTLVWSGRSNLEALKKLKERRERYDPDVIKALGYIMETETQFVTSTINVRELVLDMVLAKDIRTSGDCFLWPKDKASHQHCVSD